jgi:hypothetical protein
MRVWILLPVLLAGIACGGTTSSPSPSPAPAATTSTTTTTIPTPSSTGGSPAGGIFSGTIADRDSGTGTLTLVLNKTLPNGFAYTGSWTARFAGTTTAGVIERADATFVNASLYLLTLSYTYAGSTSLAGCSTLSGTSFASQMTLNSIVDTNFQILWNGSSDCPRLLHFPGVGSINLARQ